MIEGRGVSNFAAYVDYLHVWVQKHAECAAIAGNGSANVNEIEVKFLLHLVLRQKIGAQLEYRAQQGARPPTKHILEVNVLEATGPADELLALLDSHGVSGKQLHQIDDRLTLVISRENLHERFGVVLLRDGVTNPSQENGHLRRLLHADPLVSRAELYRASCRSL